MAFYDIPLDPLTSKRRPAMPRIAVCSLALILLSLAAAASAAEKSYTLSVDAGKFDRENTPVVATITVPDE
ncbi:MAG: hypothetical protein WEA31_05655, partial [Pirellulales bacterium]